VILAINVLSIFSNFQTHFNLLSKSYESLSVGSSSVSNYGNFQHFSLCAIYHSNAVNSLHFVLLTQQLSVFKTTFRVPPYTHFQQVSLTYSFDTFSSNYHLNPDSLFFHQSLSIPSDFLLHSLSSTCYSMTTLCLSFNLILLTLLSTTLSIIFETVYYFQLKPRHFLQRHLLQDILVFIVTTFFNYFHLQYLQHREEERIVYTAMFNLFPTLHLQIRNGQVSVIWA
jgi:hypothetical protein